MLRSLFSGVAGLKAHQTRMDVTANNISNVNTYGFKASRATFRDVYYQSLASSSNASGSKGGSNASQIGYGASVASIDLLNTRSGFASTGRGMDCYIDGEGYFVIKDGENNERLTQVGTFGFDGNGNLVDGNKNFVCGYPVDKISGRVSIGGATADLGTKNGELLDGYTVEVKYGATPAANTPASTTVAADTGKKTITITFTPGTETTPVTSLTPAAMQSALQGAWTWTNNGTVIADPGMDATEKAAISVTGGASVAETTGMIAQVAQFNYADDPVKIVNTFGELRNLSIGPDGTITGEGTDGKIKVIGRLAIANVPNPDALTMEGSSYFKAVSNTGTINYSAPGTNNLGALKTGGLEMSNVDLANEFSDMIMTQRGFQANSKIITVSDEILETLVNLKR